MKRLLGCNVYEAAQARISFVFDHFPRVYASFSGGKDSTVMLHLVAEEARRRGRVFGLLFIDLEGQYQLTIDHVRDLFNAYSDVVEPFWVALPLHLRNAVSQFAPFWVCWDKAAQKDWIRPLPCLPGVISESAYFPFFREGMEFEEFVPLFGQWYGQGQPTACFVGIRTSESLNRYRTIASKTKTTYAGKPWTTQVLPGLFNAYPVYDWTTKDVWVYHARTGSSYNRLYDRMYQAGLTIHQMRICQPYGDDQRRGLNLFHVIEPETWARVVARVNGANQGALYCGETGNILGNVKVTLPPNHTWESFARLILATLPMSTAEHYRNKIAVFLKWYKERGYPDGIPDAGPMKKGTPSWARICKALLRNDYWCKGLSFTQTKSEAYAKYQKLMQRRRQEWGVGV